MPKRLFSGVVSLASSALLIGGLASFSYSKEAQEPVAKASSVSTSASKPASQTPTSLPALDDKTPIDPDLPPFIEDPTGHALDSFFEALKLADAGHPGGRVLISQFGDSHTAADFGTSRLRRKMQGRFGDAGRGLVWAGRPVKYYDQRDGTFAQEGKWVTENGLRRTALEPFGVMGFRNTYLPPPDPKAPMPPPPKTTSKTPPKKMTKAEKAKEAALLKQKPKVTVGVCQLCPLKNVSRFEIFYRRFEQGGKMKVYLDDAPETSPIVELDTRSNPNTSNDSPTGYFSIPVEDGAHSLSIMPTGDGNVELFGIVMERDQPGVIVDALGVGGIEASALLRWDWTYVGEQLAHRDPSLVILAYGTNESANTSLNIEKLEKNYLTIIRRLKEVVPEASILVMGPPDRTVRERKDCDKPTKKTSQKKPTTKKPTQTAAKLPPIPEGCEWRTPLVIPQIVEAQRRAAMQEGVAFFDTYLFMGGSGSMDAWYKQSPSLASKDHTHLSKAGYEAVSDMIYEALLAHYERYLTNTEAAPLPETRASSSFDNAIIQATPLD